MLYPLDPKTGKYKLVAMKGLTTKRYFESQLLLNKYKWAKGVENWYRQQVVKIIHTARAEQLEK